MTQQERIDYHARRAGEEQKRSRLPGTSPGVARAHDQLAILHRQRAEALRSGALEYDG